MNCIKMSRNLESLLSNTLSMLRAEGVTSSYNDRLFVELIEHGESFARLLIEQLAGVDAVPIILRRVVDSIITAPQEEHRSLDMHFAHLETTLQREVQASHLSTVHLLRLIIADTSTAAYRELATYGIKAEDIDSALTRMINRTSTLSTTPTDRITSMEQLIALCCTDRGMEPCA